eukprot:g3341.t1
MASTEGEPGASVQRDVVAELHQKAQRLIDEAKGVAEKDVSAGFWGDMRHTVGISACMVVCSFFVFLEAGLYFSHGGSVALAVENVCSGAFILFVAFLLVYVTYQRRRALAFERIVRAEKVVARIKYNPPGYVDETSSRLSQFSTSSSSIYTALVFRNERWQLFPTNLLLKGETIAVGAGAPFPARVRVLEPLEEEKTATYERGEVFLPSIVRSTDPARDGKRKGAKARAPHQGKKSPPRKVKRTYTNEDFLKSNNEVDSSLLLTQMGHLRRYELLETPLLEHLRTFLFAPVEPDTPFDVEKGMLRRYFQYCFAALFLGSLIANVLRLVSVDPGTGKPVLVWPAAGPKTSSIYSLSNVQSSEHWSSTIFIRQVLVLVLGLAPMFTMLEFVLEAATMNQVLSTLRALVADTSLKRPPPPSKSKQCLAFSRIKAFWKDNIFRRLFRCRCRRGWPPCALPPGGDAGGEAPAAPFVFPGDHGLDEEERGEAMGRNDFYKSFNAMDQDERLSNSRLRRKLVKVDARQLVSGFWACLQHIIFGETGTAMTPMLTRLPLISSRVVERLGRVTRLCCVDENAATAGEPCVEEVFLLKGDDGEQDQSDAVAFSEFSPTKQVVKQERSMILDLCRDITQPFNIRFEQPNWREKYMLSMKPIGLCALLCGNAGRDNSNSLKVTGDAASARLADAVSERSWWDSDRALKTLAYAIGFQDCDLDVYKRRCRIHLIAPSMEREEEQRLIRPPQWVASLPQLRTHMSTIVLEQRARSGNFVGSENPGKTRQLHLMSCGHPVAVLGRCRQFWQGDMGSIWPLKKTDRKAVLSMYERWSREGFDCRTCAYTPCVPGMENMISRHKRAAVDRKMSSDSSQSATTPTVPSIYVTMKSNEVRAAFSSAIHTLPQTAPWEDKEQQMLLSQQIFLGMVASRPQPKEEMVSIIEDLDKAGIRFVYFSPHNPKRAKIMASQMGIETGWNSAVSLLSEDNTSGWTPDEWDARAKLPHGVKEVREHLKNVDNVPLLVALFTDSKPKAVNGMIEVFQENEGVVCAFGSALNALNGPLFQQADIAVAVDAVSGGVEPGIDRNEFNADRDSSGSKIILPGDTTLALAAELNALDCDFSLTSSQNTYTILELIGLCRTSLGNMRQAVWFFYAAHTILGGVVVMASCSALPPPMTVGRMLWFSWFVVPCLAITLLWCPVFKPMQRMVESGNEQVSQKRMKHILFYTVARTVPAVAMSQFIYGATVEHYSDPSSADRGASIELSRACFELFLIWTFAFVCFTFERRCDPLTARAAHPVNWPMVWVSLAFFAFHLVKCLILHLERGAGGALPVYLVVAAVLWPAVFVGIAELTKHHDHFYYTRHDRRRRLVFDTKLGMWSPK